MGILYYRLLYLDNFQTYGILQTNKILYYKRLENYKCSKKALFDSKEKARKVAIFDILKY